MPDIYESCPVLTGPTLTLRLVTMEDAADLLQVYQDEENNPYFNSDNCTSNFLIPTLEDMQQCILFWKQSYAWKQFVRWSIMEAGHAIGTVECFYRGPSDDIDDCSLLRIDLRGDRHTPAINAELLDMLTPRIKELFGGSCIAIKAPAIARERREALQARGFIPSEKMLIGHDGTQYPDYWTKPI